MSALTIIIVNWNTAALTCACLRSIERAMAAAPQLAIDVIVVDNNSADSSVADIKRDFAWVDLIDCAENLGFARANNLASQRAQGDYLLLLNPDTELRPQTIPTLLDALAADPKIGAVGPLVRNPDGTLQLSCHRRPTLLRELWRLLHGDLLFAWGIYPMERWAHDTARDVEILQGVCLLLRRALFVEIGRFDPAYQMYGEDYDLCQRMRQAGLRLVWVPQAEITHHGGQSTRQVAATMFIALYDAKLNFLRRFDGSVSGHLYKWVLTFVALVRLVGFPLGWLLRPNHRQQYAALRKNYQQLLWRLPSL